MTTIGQFNGSDYDPNRDELRLANQYSDIFNLMSDGAWRTLSTIAQITGHPPASISAQLRHARKARFGGNTVNKRYMWDGLYEYQLVTSSAGVNILNKGSWK